jgi:hypothetical protein
MFAQTYRAVNRPEFLIDSDRWELATAAPAAKREMCVQGASDRWLMRGEPLRHAEGLNHARNDSGVRVLTDMQVGD